MENVVLTVHLILAVLLTGVVLLQRSEGGGLGMGSGGGGGGVMSGRQAANWMTRFTWALGIALFVTSIGLTIIAARNVSNSSIMDQIGVPESRQGSTMPALPEYTPPPSTGGDPLTPPAPDAPAGSAAPAADADQTTPGTTAPEAAAPEATAPEAPAADVEAPAASEVETPPAPESAAPEAASEPAAENAEPTAPEQQQPAN